MRWVLAVVAIVVVLAIGIAIGDTGRGIADGFVHQRTVDALAECRRERAAWQSRPEEKPCADTR